MKILIADDSYEKVKIIAEGAKLAGIPDDMIKHVSCSKDALRELSKNKYDVFFVDIQLPAILGGDIESQGGVDLIKNIEINELINKPKFIAGITSHSETYSEIKNFFIQRGWPLLYEELSVELISKIINIRNYELEMKFDIAFIAALEHTELEAILSLPCSWTQFSVNNDPNIYYSGNLFIENGVNLKLLATSCSRMGMASASALSAKISLQFKPELIVMTGIAAGIEGKVNLGDIIVADTIWDWGSGKLTIKDKKPVLLPSPHQISLDSGLRQKIKTIAIQKKYNDIIYCNYKAGKRPAHDLTVHVGPMASGAAVLEDSSIVDNIKSHNRDIIAIEMEAYGIASAPLIAIYPPPKVLVIKSICDFADITKNDDWQKYAAYTSANFVYNFLKNDLY